MSVNQTDVDTAVAFFAARVGVGYEAEKFIRGLIE
jgi:hypothetical protein